MICKVLPTWNHKLPKKRWFPSAQDLEDRQTGLNDFLQVIVEDDEVEKLLELRKFLLPPDGQVDFCVHHRDKYLQRPLTKLQQVQNELDETTTTIRSVIGLFLLWVPSQTTDKAQKRTQILAETSQQVDKITQLVCSSYHHSFFHFRLTNSMTALKPFEIKLRTPMVGNKSGAI
jgi:hypothetical protein